MPHIPSLESRLAAWILQHGLCPRFSFDSVNALLAIERGDADVDPADAHRLLQTALQVCITHEIVAGREART